jgi:hypothetical protein
MTFEKDIIFLKMKNSEIMKEIGHGKKLLKKKKN